MLAVGCEELTTSEGPVLEEFIPLRLANSSSSGDGKSCCNGGEREADKKPDWLRSVQLWKEPEPPTVDVLRPIAVNAKRVGAGGTFHPFEREKNVKEAVVAAPASSTTDTNGGEEKEKEASRRRGSRGGAGLRSSIACSCTRLSSSEALMLRRRSKLGS
ncbi:myb family transcription factor EFM-like [Iris pallida]|uniref:Myb family transcription factor EFM-like n=1 Tax=Iris pallida TaxID=29817 RepID=A0AAX6F9V6_IRIPA|nr:myb family transcription factor EFM-like [Iris pallida]KAJ6813240.1 myb family transcription factor EFM-like [Iris pallida]